MDSKVDPSSDPFCRCRTGAGTALLTAASAGSDISSLLLQATNVNCSNGYGRTALMEGSANGHMQVVFALLVAKADVNIKCRARWSALFYAAKGRHWAVVLTLLGAAADPNMHIINPGESPLILAARAGEMSVVRALVAAGCDVDFASVGEPALMWAVASGSYPTVRCLVKAKARQRCSMQWLAAHQGSAKLLVALVGDSPPTKYDSGGPIRTAIAPCRPELCALTNEVLIIIVGLVRGTHTEIPSFCPGPCTPPLLALIATITRPWIPANHFLFPPAFCEAVWTLLLVLHRRRFFLPMTVILSFAGRDWWSPTLPAKTT